MSLTENDRVMVYGNKAERLPTLSELSEYINNNINIEEDVLNGVTAGTLQATIYALAARIQALEGAAAPVG